MPFFSFEHIRRVRTVAVALTVASLYFFSSPARSASQVEVACPRVLSPPTLDGHLDEWQPLPQAAIADPADWHPAAEAYTTYAGSEDISAELRITWDNQALYLAVETRDDRLVRVASPAELDHGDSILLSFAREGAIAVNQFVLTLLKGKSLVWRVEPASGTGEMKTIGRAIWARQEEGWGWRVTYELAIPWAELAPLRALPGEEIKLTVSLCDDDGSGIEGCLERTIPLVLTTGSIRETRPLSLPPSFAAPAVARFDRRSFFFNDREALLFAGEIDYPRLPKEAWHGRIAALKSMGMYTASLIVPWSYHQPKPDQMDFSDLEEVLTRCRQAGILVQLSAGPFAGDAWEAGAIPEWVIGLESPAKMQEAAVHWHRALFNVIKQHQLTNGGPIAAIILRPLPGAEGEGEVKSLYILSAAALAAGIHVPLLTVNTPAARANDDVVLANLLDTINFYQPVEFDDLIAKLRMLSHEENGPVVISGLPFTYKPKEPRRASDLLRIALGLGTSAITISDFAPGLNAAQSQDRFYLPGVIAPSGARDTDFGELKLVANFVGRFGDQLVRALPNEESVKCDNPEVQVSARFAAQAGFISLWDRQAKTSHQVRITYLEPGAKREFTIPEAGAINLPAGGAKILVTGLPISRGVLQYSTSEIAGLHQLGDRILLIVYGDRDTPGEIALRWPGPPLVYGEVHRQHWDPETKTLILDYYHEQTDRYILVDELEIAILSRERAALINEVRDGDGAVSLIGSFVVGASSYPDRLQATLECPPGALQITAALPQQPSFVKLDGKPVNFTFATPERVLSLAVSTEPFERERKASSVWDRLGRVIIGGPPQLEAKFDRALFSPDSKAPPVAWRPITESNAVSEFAANSFVKLRARFNAESYNRISLAATEESRMVYINGRFVSELSGTKPEGEVDLESLKVQGVNQVEILLHFPTRPLGWAGIVAGPRRLPWITLKGKEGSLVLDKWEMADGLAGEAAGWDRMETDTTGWHLLRLGPWRSQSKKLSEVTGVGWYRLPFGLPQPREWQIAYQLCLSLEGTALLYLNGKPLTTLQGSGEYLIPVPSELLNQGADNVLAAAVYGLGPETGLSKIEIAADRAGMIRRHTLEIQF